jgi:peptide/nickel transport system substrate-binding protein
MTDEDERAQAISDIQNDLAEQLPTLPYLQGSQIAVSGSDVTGIDETLDPSFQFRLALLGK